MMSPQLAEANRTIARLKGDLLKLTTEAQSAMLNENTADDALIEENEELKTQVSGLVVPLPCQRAKVANQRGNLLTKARPTFRFLMIL